MVVDPSLPQWIGASLDLFFPEASEKFLLSYYNTPMVSIILVIFFRTELWQVAAKPREMASGGVVGAEPICRHNG
jgi:hypothetical protein